MSKKARKVVRNRKNRSIRLRSKAEFIPVTPSRPPWELLSVQDVEARIGDALQTEDPVSGWCAVCYTEIEMGVDDIHAFCPSCKRTVDVVNPVEHLLLGLGVGEDLPDLDEEFWT